MELDPNSANKIGNYARFLTNIRKKYDQAEEYYKKAIKLDSNNVNNIGSYALFLSDIRKKYDQAEAYYKKAMELNPNSANNIGNYAHHIIISSHDFHRAETYIDRAFEIVNSKNLSLLSELWFYRYAHYVKWLDESKEELEILTKKSAKSIGWNLDSHIKIAKMNDHPNISKLVEFANLITK